ncbi:integrase [Thermaurantimonas aggregans]|uniref:Integrase n=1 Tax=Thermaurantimonas aggregans TaxID=2173829 RepID=A0A401XKH2_9FLAO|nr:tyrosine-type recombinase/integrase [Thermaurantimonas aggregans]MCX8149360.1 tyrosine-type recombinase/integrase [Thermaurantimonas aggregans]GCD77508.1 integrase [Thermaurantimonas aggregans]
MSNQVLLNDFFEYLEKVKNRSIHTLEAYRRDIEAFLTYFENQDLTQFNPKQIRHYAAYLSKLELKPSSIRRKLSALQALFRFLKKNKYISSVPTNLVVRPKLPRRVKDIPKEAELAKLESVELGNTRELDFETVRDFCIIELLYGTGIRRQELIDLTLGDVDLSAASIKVTGKGSKQRIVPLNDYLKELLSVYISFREKLTTKDDTAFFLTKKGKKVNKSLVYVIVKSYLSAVTDVHQKSPHMLRHAFATHMLSRGADLRSIRELLGHSSLAATQVYTQNDVSKLKSVYNRFHPRSN